MLSSPPYASAAPRSFAKCNEKKKGQRGRGPKGSRGSAILPARQGLGKDSNFSKMKNETNENWGRFPPDLSFVIGHLSLIIRSSGRAKRPKSCAATLRLPCSGWSIFSRRRW